MNIIEKKGNNALIEKECDDVESRDSYILICALNYQYYEGMTLYDNGPNESVKFSVSSHAPQEVKNKLLQVAKAYFDSLN